jgi:hypothetical protein
MLSLHNEYELGLLHLWEPHDDTEGPPSRPVTDSNEEAGWTSSLSAAFSFIVQGQKDLPIKGDGPHGNDEKYASY